jgi:23S rRNA (adenine2030-N6)-methyltransferase
MLSYQHLYHAGCLADVHKHGILSLLLSELASQVAPLAYIETHAGRGLYDLSSWESERTGEAQNGILRLMKAKRIAPDSPYATVLHQLHESYGPLAYPGSPMIAKLLLRPSDRIFLMELHPKEYAALEAAIQAPNIRLAKQDGYEKSRRILSALPPHMQAVILIDPSYEMKLEYQTVARYIIDLHHAYPRAIIMAWYPILEHAPHQEIHDLLQGAGLTNYVRHEICFPEAHINRAKGSGVLLVNSPQVEVDLVEKWFLG